MKNDTPIVQFRVANFLLQIRLVLLKGEIIILGKLLQVAILSRIAKVSGQILTAYALVISIPSVVRPNTIPQFLQSTLPLPVMFV
ncbi:hypothetical protein C460_08325 [Haloferax sp. ATCC BAA-646]|nr:hypothetical protein C460_08325 [Haloferax sp. ATCC BAA-646]